MESYPLTARLDSKHIAAVSIFKILRQILVSLLLQVQIKIPT